MSNRSLPRKTTVTNAIEIANVNKSFALGAVSALRDVSLEIRENEFYTLLGPSGCGKTTLLRMIAGLEFPDSGEIKIRGTPMATISAHERPVNMVFQNYALFPHLTVSENVSFGPRQRRPRPPKSELDDMVHVALAMVRLEGYQKRRTYELSGGQQQRVALARAIINRPAVLALDEPLAALDKKLRYEMQFELKELQKRVGITFLMVTHDQQEALSMSDRVCVMNHGCVAQIGTPEEVYNRPASRFVAEFVGRANFFQTADPGRSLSVRPEWIELAPAGGELAAGISEKATATIVNRVFFGENVEYQLISDTLGKFSILRPANLQTGALGPGVGDVVKIGWRIEAERIIGDE
jgi:spermidine/putrescine transport system ATP-binding protein